MSDANLEKRIESIEADIAAFKLMLPAPRGFESWEQFDSITNQAFAQFNKINEPSN